MKTNLSPFIRAYLAAALWSSTDDAGEPMDANYDISDFAPQALERAEADCIRFQAQNGGDIAAANIRDSDDTPSLAGFLFWLNRNGHGSGFWDEKTHRDPDAECAACNRLSDAASAFGSVDLYAGDDGKLYFF